MVLRAWPPPNLLKNSISTVDQTIVNALSFPDAMSVRDDGPQETQFDGGKRVPATISAIVDAVRWAEEILKAIDDRGPAGR
jgi:hypothetical protein